MNANIAPETTRQLFEDNIHPRIFFGPEDIPALRDKSRTGFGQALREEILGRARRYTDPDSPDYVDPNRTAMELFQGFGGGVFNTTADALHCLSFAWLLTDDVRWRDAGIALLRTMTLSPDVSMKLCEATLGNQVTLAFDVFYHELTQDDRAKMRDFLRCRVEAYRRNQIENPRQPFWGIGTNIFQREFEKYVVTLAAIYEGDEDRRALIQAVPPVRRSIHMGLDVGGAIFEGPGYGWRDAEWLSFMAEVFLRTGVADLWHSESRFANMCRNWAYLLLPGKQGQNDYCDAARVRNRPHVGALLHARRLDDPVVRWVWQTLGGRGEIGKLGPAPAYYNCHLGLVLLWEDETAPAKRPDHENWPTSRLSGKVGLITMRSGWTDDDLYFNLLASTRDPGCQIHQQIDAGHFTLAAHGELYSVDSGYGDIAGKFHSVMRPHGEDPSRATRRFDQTWYGGRTQQFAAGQNADYACVNIGEQWECHWAYRHAMLIKPDASSGIEPYVVVVDNMNFGQDHMLYQWQLNSEPGNRIEVDQDQERATIHGRKHRLDLAWSYPKANEFNIPHRLELSTRTMESVPRGEYTFIEGHRFGVIKHNAKPRGGGWTGLGPRPQLVADLYGYNGQLLTVMTPRRANTPALPTQPISGPGQHGLIIDHGDVQDTIITSAHHRRIDLAGITGEARLTVVRRDAKQRIVWWAAADVFQLSAAGQTLVAQRGEPMTLVEGGAS